MRSRYFGLSTGTTLEGIASKWFTKLFLPYSLDLQEQTKIFEILQMIEEQIANQTQTKYNYNLMKKALMQKLLTGKIRVMV